MRRPVLLVVLFSLLGIITVHGACMEAVAGHDAGAETVAMMGADPPGSDRTPDDPPCHELGEADHVTLPAPSFLLFVALCPLGFAWRPSLAAALWEALRTLSRRAAGGRSRVALCVIRI